MKSSSLKFFGSKLQRSTFVAIGILIFAGLVWNVFHKNPSPKQFFTIYVLGGSTSRGVPYDPYLDFGELVKVAYDGKIDGRPVKVVNLAQSGKAIHWVEGTLRDSDGEADLVLLYSGNNEFLEFDQEHDLSVNTRTLFDTPLVSHEKREEVFKRYEESLQRIVAYCKERNIPLFLFTLSVNWSDWEPNRSVLADNRHAVAVNELFQTGNRLLADRDYRGAIKAFQDILSIEPQFAYAHMMIADSYKALSDFKMAKEHYRKAADFDMSPDRVTSRQNLYIKRIAAQGGGTLVDTVALLENASTNGLIGFNWMWDNCHPTFEGYLLIAREISKVMKEQFHLKEDWDLSDPDYVMTRLGITDSYKLQVAGARGRNCYGVSTAIFNPERRLERARYYLQSVEKVTPNDPDLLCGLAVLSLLTGELNEAETFWRRAYRLNPEMTEERLTHPRVKEIFQRWNIDDPLAVVQQ